jgi:hypothetical protein
VFDVVALPGSVPRPLSDFERQRPASPRPNAEEADSTLVHAIARVVAEEETVVEELE